MKRQEREMVPTEETAAESATSLLEGHREGRESISRSWVAMQLGNY